MATKLYVGNLSYDTSEDRLRTHFEQAGTVTSCQVMLDRDTQRSRGFAFVEMGSQDEANKAIEQFNGQDLDGRPLVVNEARPRPDRAPRGDFGGMGSFRSPPPPPMKRGSGKGSRRGARRAKRERKAFW